MVGPEAHRLTVVHDGERLDRFLHAHLGEQFSRARLQRLIADGHVEVDGEPSKASAKLRAGMTVSVEVPPPAPTVLIPEARPLDILFEDADLIAIVKPAGVPVHPGAGHTSGTMVHALLAHCGDLSGIGGVERPGIVHRLDKDTSGVLVVAKNDFAHERISAQFAERRTEKSYRAYVLGTPSPSRRRIETLMGRHPTHRKRFSSRVSRGKRAVSAYEVLGAGSDIAELSVRIETGRTHQIRVHLADLGHPVVADALYGGTRWSRIRDDALRTVARALGRQALHAERLVLVHPRSGETLDLRAPLPVDLERLRDAGIP